MSLSAGGNAGSPPVERGRGIFPAMHWLRNYDPHWLHAYLAAGVTLAAYLLPAAIGDASLAGLLPQAGLYACLFGGLVFWLFCSLRQTAVSVTSEISLLIASSLGNLAGADPAHFAELVVCTALLTAAIAFIGAGHLDRPRDGYHRRHPRRTMIALGG